MREILKMTGSLLLIALILAHLFLIGLFVAPVDKLLKLTSIPASELVNASDIPEDTVHFLIDNRVPVRASYTFDSSSKARLIEGILQLRELYFMDETERLALEMNLLAYDEKVVGVGSASSYFFGKSFITLTPKEWITLINLHDIYLRNKNLD